MSEPTITIPAREALIIAKLMEQVNTVLFPGRAPKFQKRADVLKQALVDQLSCDDIDIAVVAAKIEESA